MSEFDVGEVTWIADPGKRQFRCTVILPWQWLDKAYGEENFESVRNLFKTAAGRALQELSLDFFREKKRRAK